MPAVSTYSTATRTSGDFLLGTNSAGTVKRFAESGREMIYGTRNYYVRTDGSDSNTGLVNNAGGAFLTLQKACDIVVSLDLADSSATVIVNIGAGSFAGCTLSAPWGGSGSVYFVGAGVG